MELNKLLDTIRNYKDLGIKAKLTSEVSYGNEVEMEIITGPEPSLESSFDNIKRAIDEGKARLIEAKASLLNVMEEIEKS